MSESFMLKGCSSSLLVICGPSPGPPTRSILGLLVSPFFFVFHLLDFVVHHPSGAIVLQSAYVGGPLLIRTGLVGLLVIFLYAVISYLAFGGAEDFACTTLYGCIAMHFVNAIASSSIGGLFNEWDTIPDSVFDDVRQLLRTGFIVSFLIVWVFLLQNIFTGQVSCRSRGRCRSRSWDRFNGGFRGRFMGRYTIPHGLGQVASAVARLVARLSQARQFLAVDTLLFALVSLCPRSCPLDAFAFIRDDSAT